MPAVELPAELTDLIIGHLHKDKPALMACALVCRKWVASSRAHLFCHIILFRDGVERFISLYDSPFSTIHRANTSSFLLTDRIIPKGKPEPDYQHLESNLALNKLLAWRSLDGQTTLATIFSQLRRLTITYIEWQTLSASSKETLSKFESLRELQIDAVFENRGQFLALLGMFPNLETLSLIHCCLRNGEGTANAGDPSPSIAPPSRLHAISIYDIDPPIVDALALFPWYSLRILDFQFCDLFSFELACGIATAIEKLVASAGPSLEVFLAEASSDRKYSGAVKPCVCFELIDLSKNTSLQQICLDIEENGRVQPFLRRLADATIYSKPFTPTLQSLNITNLPVLSVDWEDLDMLLQHPYFSALSKLQYTVTADFYHRDCIGQPRFTGGPNPGSDAHRTMLQSVEEFGARLPLCRARGILRPHESYRWAGGSIRAGSDWAEDPDNTDDTDDTDSVEYMDDADDDDGVGNESNVGDALSA
ncbi:hypothetical protein BOTBODRAFT_192915 [Botryobasidium botryosum FD-172 SS1]|uniref:F-box domain-containing protein n=1 Tax=Botryobasidium botryosum (strain FD-172 SS1) TaxID=930990 RepID=A0A067LTT0_BOTB1|nr:hypothetical protein BOTBODRAFT_192915 [Botryobasidium botryosum FD-172 SS1]